MRIFEKQVHEVRQRSQELAKRLEAEAKDQKDLTAANTLTKT